MAKKRTDPTPPEKKDYYNIAADFVQDVAIFFIIFFLAKLVGELFELFRLWNK